MPVVSTALLIAPPANATSGIRLGVSSSEYHSEMQLGLVSKSGLDKVARSPAHYKAWVDGTAVSKSTPALEFGTATHMALLEPELFATRYVVEPVFGDLRKTANKQARGAWLEEHADKLAISQSDSDKIAGMRASVSRHPAACRLLTQGRSEVTLRWVDAETGLQCKSRADKWIEELRLAVDLKTTDDASPDAFARSVYNYRYHVQDALYRDGFAACGAPIEHFAIVAVEKDPPFAVAVYTLDARAVSLGYEAARAGIEMINHCMSTGRWEAYSNGVEELSLPKWAI